MFFFSDIKHELVRDGVSQSERQLAALSPDSIQVDERNTEALLNFIYEYARQVNYYQGSSDQSADDWTAFFDKSIPFQIAQIAQYDAAQLLSQFEALKSLITSTGNFSDLENLFDLIYSIVEILSNWREGLEGDTSGVLRAINNLIKTNLSFSLKKLLGYTNAARQWNLSLDFDLDALNSIWGVGGENLMDRYAIDRTLLDKKGSDQDKIDFALNAIEELFLVFYKGLVAIIEIAAREDTVEKSIDGRSDHSPHLGLLFAFLRLFKQAQGDLNRMTNEHLEFFYKNVLQLKTKPAVPDHVHLVFTLAEQLKEHRLAKGTLLKAGTDESGADIVFELEDEIIVNKASVQSLKTLYLDQERLSPDDTTPTIKNVFYAPAANMADGVKEQFPPKVVSSWSTLGNDESKFKPDPESEDYQLYPFARLGLVIASKVLWLREGERTITFTVTCSTSVPEELQTNQGVFKAQFSGEEGWFELGEDGTVTLSRGGADNEELIITVVLSPAAPAIFFPGTEFFEVDYGHEDPMMALILDHEKAKIEDTDFSLYQKLRCLKMEQVNIDVKVCGVRNLLVQDESGLIDVSKPFQPFGPNPVKDSSNFKIGSEEAFCKNWTALNFNVEWKGKPEPFDTYYEAYPANIQENSFRIQADYLLDSAWLPDNVLDSRYLFLDDAGRGDHPDICTGDTPAKVWKFINSDFGDPNQDLSCTNFPDLLEDFEEIPQCGFIRLRLTGQDFQHLEYPNLLATQLLIAGARLSDNANALPVIEADTRDVWLIPRSEFDEAVMAADDANTADAKVRDGDTDADKEGLDDIDSKANQDPINVSQLQQNIVETSDLLSNAIGKGVTARNEIGGLASNQNINNIGLLNPPYTPEIESISLDYKASATLKDTKLIHLYPDEATYLHLHNGEADVLEESQPLLPKVVEEGTLFIGLQDLDPGNNLNLFIQIADSTADPDIDKARICWHYLKGNQWKLLKKDFHILADETEGLIRPGIVEFALPPDISSTGTTILPNHLNWLKASAIFNTKAVGEIISIHAQGGRVVFQHSAANATDRLSNPLPAESIGKFVEKNAAIDSILQPFEGFGGKREELPTTFYTRISEHLRHKGRAITLYDYERLILEAFPEVFKVKCITHTLGQRGKNKQDIELAPGFVTVVVIPDLRNYKVVDPFEPKASLSLLTRIETFLKDKMSPFVKLRVLNPIYERISISTEVSFTPGKSVDFYIAQLKKDIRQFLAPWAFGEGLQKISFGGRIFKSAILKFVEDLDYVDFVVNFTMQKEGEEEVDPIIAETARSILVAAAEHTITEFDKASEPGNPRLASMRGVGFAKIES
ncbi:MAG: hypothetical protein AAFZ63_10585 [Bacteroidota bacterium]